MKLTKYIAFLGWLLIPVLSLLWIKNIEQKEEAEKAHRTLIATHLPTRYYVDAMQRTHAYRQQAEASLKTIKALYQSLLDSVSKATGIKPKHLQSIATLSTTQQREVMLLVDTVYLPTGDTSTAFSYSDKWLQLSGTLKPQARLQYRLYDSLILTTYTKRSGLLRQNKSTYVDAYSINPHTTVKNITALKVATYRPKKISLGPYIGYGYNGAKFTPSIGIGVHYNLINF